MASPDRRTVFVDCGRIVGKWEVILQIEEVGLNRWMVSDMRRFHKL
jgi:hypothetical protein